MLFKKDSNYLEINDGDRAIGFYKTRFYRDNSSRHSVSLWICLISEMEYEMLCNLSDDAIIQNVIIPEIILREIDESKQNAYLKVYNNVVKKIAEKKNIVDEMVNSIKLD